MVSGCMDCVLHSMAILLILRKLHSLDFSKGLEVSKQRVYAKYAIAKLELLISALNAILNFTRCVFG
jgi:hypothetical protein